MRNPIEANVSAMVTVLSTQTGHLRSSTESLNTRTMRIESCESVIEQLKSAVQNLQPAASLAAVGPSGVAVASPTPAFPMTQHHASEGAETQQGTGAPTANPAGLLHHSQPQQQHQCGWGYSTPPRTAPGGHEGVPHYPMTPGAHEWEKDPPNYRRDLDSLARPSKLEDKTAVSEAMKFPDNKRDRIPWVKTTQNYFIGKYPELEFMLD